ncbi:DUF3833 domain-containing protein [Vibrio breoganii]|uniref:DUF3833 domain-containing protein n=1 Tax=Vibrio breoganii TaxID=553239 RepID=UPI000C85DDB8|nr:DUF3833 domain-containing protein [Vibrio breoganii]PML61623.1 hypothetical protein BCT73_00770 [Vibrio breoganii]PMO86307.1 hypothetical protein BCT00_00100 [Vibrio breoganii]
MISRKVKAFLALIGVLHIMGCSADLSDYQQDGPKFDLFGYFEGSVTVWGMVQDRSGKQTRRFEVDLNGSVEGNVLTLNEDFVFDDGEESTRIWVITRLEDGTYEGRADDIIGVASGEEVGNALRWTYDFELPRGDSTVVVGFDDWLYRQDEKHLFNLTSIRKFGIEFGTLTLFFQRND